MNPDAPADPDWAWYAGYNDEEYCIGPLPTRDCAIDEARSDGLDGGDGFFITEARKDPLRLSREFSADWLLNQAEDNVCDFANESGDPIFEVTTEQEKDLEFVVRAAIDRWQKRHDLTFVPWVFTQTRNEEFIETTKEEGHTHG